MAIALLKLGDIVLRASFILVPLYLLEPGAAGQFGLLSTLITFYAFLIGFESYGAMQRQLAVANEAQTRGTAASLLRFYAFNYLVVSPLFCMLAAFWLKLSAGYTALALFIVVGEVLSNEAYRLALVAKGFRMLFSTTVIKNLAGVVALLAFVAVDPSGLSLSTVITIWAGACTVGLLLAGALWLGRGVRSMNTATWSIADLMERYRASFAFFSIGIVALCSVQIDRFIVGAVGGLEVAGIYFKNLFLAASVYQVGTVLFHNRVVARVYQAVAESRLVQGHALIRRESLKVAIVYPSIMAMAAAILAWPGAHQLADRAFLRTEYLVGLLTAFMLRTIADYSNLFLNALKREQSILVTHAVTVVVASLSNILLTRALGIRGTVASVLLASVVMILLSRHFMRRAMHEKREAV